MYEDREGHLWVGTYRGGLSRLDRESGRFARFVHDPGDPYSLGSGRVGSVLQDHNGDLWVGTDSGLYLQRRGEPGFVGYRHKTTDPRSLSDDKITTIY